MTPKQSFALRLEISKTESEEGVFLVDELELVLVNHRLLKVLVFAHEALELAFGAGSVHALLESRLVLLAQVDAFGENDKVKLVVLFVFLNFD